MTDQELLLWAFCAFFCVWALSATAACIWYQAQRTQIHKLGIELRRINTTISDLISIEQAQQILSIILSGRRA